MQATGHFARASDQVGRARSFVRETLGAWGLSSRVDDAVLMVSELFTNAVLHGEGDVDVSLVLEDGNLRIEVADDGAGTVPTRARSPRPESVTGRGLAIVDALADSWGNGRDQRGRTRVWLEVPGR
jgi:anti-sigma regulatory factor (Ser/Thr protein kinase)